MKYVLKWMECIGLSMGYLGISMEYVGTWMEGVAKLIDYVGIPA